MKLLKLILLFSLLCVSFAASWDFDNVKEFTQTDSLGKIEIINAFGLGSTLAEYELLENSNQCLIDCYAEGTVRLNEAALLFSELKFEGRNKSLRLPKQYNLYLINEKLEIWYDNVYEEQCNGYEHANGSYVDNCQQIVIGVKQNKHNITSKVEYGGEELNPGVYRWRLEAKKSTNEDIDWIGTSFGIDLDDWAWWNGAWNKKQSITITEQNNTLLSNYQVNITLPYDASMNSDFSDIRFTNGTETTELDFFLINKTDSQGATFRVEVPIVGPGQTETIYVYFDNAAAVSASSGVNTFIFFDNFNNSGDCFGNSARWVKTSGSPNFTCNSSGLSLWGIDSTRTETPTAWHTKGRAIGTLVRAYNPTGDSLIGSSNGDGNERWLFFDNTLNVVRFSSGAGYGGSTIALEDNNYNIWELAKGGTYYHIASKNYANFTYDTDATNGNATTQIRVSANTGSSFNIKFLYVRNWTQLEPSVSLGAIVKNVNFFETPNITNAPLYYNSVINCSVNYTGTISGSYVNFTWYKDNTHVTTYDTQISVPTNATFYYTNNPVTEVLVKGEAWICSVVGYDGTDFLTKNSTAVTVSNTAPTTPVQQYPTNNGFNVTNNIEFKCNGSTDPDGDTVNYELWGNFTDDFVILQNQSLETYNLVPWQNGTFKWQCRANDNITTSSYTANRTLLVDTSIIYYVQESHQATVIGDGIKYFYFNVSFNNLSISSVNVTFHYNNTLRQVSKNNYAANKTLFNSSFYILPINVDNTLNWTITLFYSNGSTATQAFNYSQTVLDLPNMTVNTSCTEILYKFNLVDEENLTNINNGVFEYNFKYGKSNTTIKHVYGKIENSQNFSLCINTSGDMLYMGEGQIFYYAPGYVDRRYYLFTNTTLYDYNGVTNITLHNLLDTIDTSFQLQIETTSLEPYENIYASLIRWYPDLNQYRTVEMGKTDNKGETVSHVVIEDVDYRIGVYELNGDLIYLADPIRMVCSSAPCVYTLSISGIDIDYTSFSNIDFLFTYNRSTKIWTFSYSDPSQTTSTMNLSVYRDTGTTSTLICNSFYSGYVGVVTCNTSGYTGNLRGEVYRAASPAAPLASKLISELSTPFKSSFGLWLSLIMAIPVICLGVLFGPIAAFIFTIISLVPALYLGAINLTIFGGIIILAGIVAHFLKRARGN